MGEAARKRSTCFPQKMELLLSLVSRQTKKQLLMLHRLANLSGLVQRQFLVGGMQEVVSLLAVRVPQEILIQLDDGGVLV